MTNTYNSDADIFTKFYEELRCLRCVMERLLRVFDESKFVDYQMEKFAGCPSERQKIMKNVKVVTEGLESAIELERKFKGEKKQD